MDSGRIKTIKSELATKSTKELFDIWAEQNSSKWSSEALEAISSLLSERGIDLSLFSPIIQQSANEVDITYAGFWKRLAASFIDSFVLAFIQLVAVFVLFLFFHTKLLTLNPNEIPDYLKIVFSGLGIVLSWLYFAGMESSDRQATYGKSWVGIKVTDLHGKRISFMKATTRFITKLVSQSILFIGYLMAGFTTKKQALHDMMAQCLVVNE
jgi:uncharacterized RDD family membrane protein YckC